MVQERFIYPRHVLLDMPRQAIEQASCTACGENDENYTVEDTSMRFEVDAVKYDTRCQCSERGTVVVDGDGTFSNSSVSHEDTSWNEEDDEESDDE